MAKLAFLRLRLILKKRTKGGQFVEKSETEIPKSETAQSGNDRPEPQSHIMHEEVIYERAEYIFRLTDSLIFILLASMSGGIVGFFFAGAFNVAALCFVSMTLGLLMGYVTWGTTRNKEH